MPTELKESRVKELTDKLERCSIAISTNYAGMNGDIMTELRQRMRTAGLEFVVVKNTLVNLAAEAAKRPNVKDIVQGPTAMVFAYSDPQEAVKALTEYIRTARSTLAILGAVTDRDQVLTPPQITHLASLPPKPQLVANLLGQLQTPVQRLLGVLNRPLINLDLVLQARVRQLESTQTGA